MDKTFFVRSGQLCADGMDKKLFLKRDDLFTFISQFGGVRVSVGKTLCRAVASSSPTSRCTNMNDRLSASAPPPWPGQVTSTAPTLTSTTPPPPLPLTDDCSWLDAFEDSGNFTLDELSFDEESFSVRWCLAFGVSLCVCETKRSINPLTLFHVTNFSGPHAGAHILTPQRRQRPL